MSKTKQALQYMTDNPSITSYAVAKLFGISRSAISAELKRQADRAARICPCCGNVPRRFKSD